MRVFLGLDDTCGYYSRLERGFKELGIDTELVIAYPSREYPRVRRCSVLGRLVEALGKNRVRNKRQWLFYRLYTLLEAISLAALMLYELTTCDVFVFAGGVTFLQGFDLPLLRLLRKKVIIVFHGSDSRPPYLNGAYTVGEARLGSDQLKKLTKKVWKHVRYCEKYASYIVQLPYTGHFHTKKFINFLAIGIPSVEEGSRTKTVRNGQETVRILHAPSRPRQKGTPVIIETVNRLRSEGFDIELDVIVGKTPAEVFEAIERCDLVVDELYSDTPLAGLGSEAMSHGKAVVVGVNESDALLATIPPEMRPPSIICTAATLFTCLKKTISSNEFLRSRSVMGSNFIKHQWSAKTVASRYKLVIDGGCPDSWRFNPYSLVYSSGWGMTRSEISDSVASFLQLYGKKSMLLSDKKRLIDILSRLANRP